MRADTGSMYCSCVVVAWCTHTLACTRDTDELTMRRLMRVDNGSMFWNVHAHSWRARDSARADKRSLECARWGLVGPATPYGPNCLPEYEFYVCVCMCVLLFCCGALVCEQCQANSVRTVRHSPM